MSSDDVPPPNVEVAPPPDDPDSRLDVESAEWKAHIAAVRAARARGGELYAQAPSTGDEEDDVLFDDFAQPIPDDERIFTVRGVGKDGRITDSYENGGIFVSGKDYLKKQRGLVWEFVRNMGATLMDGKNLVNVSLPVRIFEPRSFLMRIADEWSLAPHLLTKAAEATDPVERFKYVIAFAIGGLHLTCKQDKPFNPILGETYEARFDDGSMLYLEQTSHHPPVSHWQLFGKDKMYHYHGYGEFIGSFRGNKIKGQRKGPNVVEFPDGNKIIYHIPAMTIGGILWGDRVTEYNGTIRFVDVKNGLLADVKLDPGPGFFKSMFSSKPKIPSDTISGAILRVPKGGPVPDEREVERLAKDKKSVLSTLSGTWLGYVDFDGKRYWDVLGDAGNRVLPQPVELPIPSDSRNRMDLKYLSYEDMASSSKWKVVLEERQRADRKYRKEHGPN